MDDDRMDNDREGDDTDDDKNDNDSNSGEYYKLEITRRVSIMTIIPIVDSHSNDGKKGNGHIDSEDDADDGGHCG